MGGSDILISTVNRTSADRDMSRMRTIGVKRGEDALCNDDHLTTRNQEQLVRRRLCFEEQLSAVCCDDVTSCNSPPPNCSACSSARDAKAAGSVAGASSRLTSVRLEVSETCRGKTSLILLRRT